MNVEILNSRIGAAVDGDTGTRRPRSLAHFFVFDFKIVEGNEARGVHENGRFQPDYICKIKDRACPGAAAEPCLIDSIINRSGACSRPFCLHWETTAVPSNSALEDDPIAGLKQSNRAI